ncbi:MAG: tRNA (adenosine(37)-N6)-dimethylallyltransferase MiaA [Oscillospiraceae bacterium]|jgi:tRNA dimethylallyltransferase|nr:tRNA (adenosine(37)-N6)-dimethylallyltransferase MiaA [Oscillospiraceae bacterium]
MTRVVVLTGPTATGKTALGVALAQECGGEVISADSMQIYRHMDVGTAKPTALETGGVRHHMIDVASPLEAYSVARYSEEASAAVDDVAARGLLPIIVGGAGLFIDSLVLGRSFAPEDASGLRSEIEAEYDTLGGEKMLEALAEFDPEAARRLAPRDKKRLVRAMEVYRLTGKTLSAHDEETRRLPPRYDALYITLGYDDRARLYERIDDRVDDMLRRGFLDEAKALLRLGLTKSHNAAQAIGYREMLAAATGEMPLPDAVELTKTRSRQYAKRQLTWLRRTDAAVRISWQAKPDFNHALRVSTEYIRAAGYI